MAKRVCFIVILLMLSTFGLMAQSRISDQSLINKNTLSTNNTSPSSNKDSSFLQHRNDKADSITLFYRAFNSTKNQLVDSSLNDFHKRYVLPYYAYNLGNYGTAAKSVLFDPTLKPGFDPGFHQYDMYNYTVENTKFYNTTKPYTGMSYLLGSNSEHMIDIVPTQNHKDNFNFSLEYRFSNTPGFLRNQNASNSNIRITTHYKSPYKRYEWHMIFIVNKNSSSENGGLDSLQKLKRLSLNDPFEVETRLGNVANTYRNPFNTTVNTGNLYNQTLFVFRHHYDIGQKDSLRVNDSTLIRYFYPRLSVQHTLTVEGNTNNFVDNQIDSFSYYSYKNNYHLKLGTLGAISFKDHWNMTGNELSIVTYPDKKNISQYLKLGASFQSFKGVFNDSTQSNYYDLSGVAEYKNRTKNNIWDIDANGQLYLNGYHAGDYSANIMLKRQLSKRIGDLTLGFQNVNSSPSFLFTPQTGFPITDKQNFNKQNITKLSVKYDNPADNFLLKGEYFLINNYLYSDSFLSLKQDAKIFNVLHISAEKKFKLTKSFNWYIEAHLQQPTGGSPINIPLLFVRNRIALEGNYFKNLFLSTGFEVKYYSNYSPSDYSPFTGQFFYQNTFTTDNRPDINFFFNFRIKSFKLFARVENLNTIGKNLSFNNYSFNTNLYPNPGLWYRLGIWWNFVN